LGGALLSRTITPSSLTTTNATTTSTMTKLWLSTTSSWPSWINRWTATTPFHRIRWKNNSHSDFYSTTSILSMPLDEFRDSIPREKRMVEEVGRSWTVDLLQRKSYQDLHKLWYVNRHL
jgi:hypothetical protein